jgi:hypothetical protein
MEAPEQLMLDYLAAWNACEPERVDGFFAEGAL